MRNYQGACHWTDSQHNHLIQLHIFIEMEPPQPPSWIQAATPTSAMAVLNLDHRRLAGPRLPDKKMAPMTLSMSRRTNQAKSFAKFGRSVGNYWGDQEESYKTMINIQIFQNLQVPVRRCDSPNVLPLPFHSIHHLSYPNLKG